MAKSFTSSVLIESVKRRANIPLNQVTFKDADILAFANEEMSLGLVPSIMRVHEDYMLYSEETPLIAAKTNYAIPHRAIGNKLRDVKYKDTNGNLYEMTRVPVDNEEMYSGSASTSSIHAFTVKNNEIYLLPYITGAVTGSLVFYYYIRPNEMVDEDRCAIITSINTTTGEITIDDMPEDFSLSLNYDLISAKSPYNHLSIELTATSINSTTNVIQFDPADLPYGLSVGDYVNIEQECIVPQVPYDLHVVLAHRVANRCLEAQGDTEGLANASKKLAEMEFNLNTLVDNRVEGSPQKVIAKYSPLRMGLNKRRYRGRG